MTEEKKFPIQGRENYTGEAVKIPWNYAAEAYKEYSARHGTHQSLERLAERQGFGVWEIIDLLVGRIRRIEKERQ
jgi:hypothetical protein